MNDHKPPFCWCHDEAIPDEVFYEAETDEERMERLSWRHRCVLIPVEAFEQPDAAQEEPQDGQEPADEPGEELEEHETYVTSWDELLYTMTNGEMGTKPPETPRRYEPPRR